MPGGHIVGPHTCKLLRGRDKLLHSCSVVTALGRSFMRHVAQRAGGVLLVALLLQVPAAWILNVHRVFVQVLTLTSPLDKVALWVAYYRASKQDQGLTWGLQVGSSRIAPAASLIAGQREWGIRTVGCRAIDSGVGNQDADVMLQLSLLCDASGCLYGINVTRWNRRPGSPRVVVAPGGFMLGTTGNQPSGNGKLSGLRSKHTSQHKYGAPLGTTPYSHSVTS